MGTWLTKIFNYLSIRACKPRADNSQTVAAKIRKGLLHQKSDDPNIGSAKKRKREFAMIKIPRFSMLMCKKRGILTSKEIRSLIVT